MREIATQTIINSMVPGHVYRRQELKPYSNNLSRDLNKLVEDGEIIKAAPGLYYKPEITRFGARGASDVKLVQAFLNDDDYLLTSLSEYNPLGLKLTQMYNEIIVYNRKRCGNFELDGRRFSFRRPSNFPKKLTKEFLFVDVLNNRDELAEDISDLENLIERKIADLDNKALLEAATKYGKVYTKKFYQGLLTP